MIQFFGSSTNTNPVFVRFSGVSLRYGSECQFFGVDCDDRDSEFFGETGDRFWFNDDGRPGFDCQDSSAELVNQFDRFQADCWQIKSKVLLRPPNFHDCKPPTATEISCSFDTGISPLNGLNSNDVRVIYDDSLSNIQPAELSSQFPSGLDVAPLF